MYKQGVAFLCLSISTILLGWVAIAQLAPNAMSAMISVAQSAQSASNVMSATDMTSVINASDSNIMSIITYVVLGILLAIRIIIALFADNYYKTRVIQIIKDVDEKLKNGASFIQNPMMADSSDITNDQNLLKKLYLQRRGGVSLFPPIIAWLAIEMLLTII
jgi:preprotein translocase subunit SecG